MAGHDHDLGGGRAAEHVHDPDVALTVATNLGLAVARVNRTWLPLPFAVVQGGLALAFLAGGVPAADVALKELFGRGRLDIDLLMVIAGWRRLRSGRRWKRRCIWRCSRCRSRSLPL